MSEIIKCANGCSSCMFGGDDTCPIKDNPYWENIEKMAEKQRLKGLNKYGRGLEDNPLVIEDRLTYLQEELIDGLMYIEHIKAYIEKREMELDQLAMRLYCAGDD